MPVYLMPMKQSDAPETEALIEKAGFPLYSPETLYDYVRLTNFAETQFFALPDLVFTKLMRNLGDLTPPDEFPKVLFGVPGYPASPRFTSESAAIVGEEWRSLEPSLLKSGLVSDTTSDAQDRSTAARKGIAPKTEKQGNRVTHKLQQLGTDDGNDDESTNTDIGDEEHFAMG